jgi:hypothetical protein
VGVERPQRHCGRLKERVCHHYHRAFQSLWVAVRYDTVLHVDSLALSLFIRLMFMMAIGPAQSARKFPMSGNRQWQSQLRISCEKAGSHQLRERSCFR